MNKLQKILSGFLIAQIILIAVVFYSNRTPPKTNQPLLDGYDAAQISKITITDPDGTEIIFEKLGEDWVLPNNGNYPVIDTSLTGILESLGQINSGRLVASTSGSHSRLQVEEDNFVKKLTVEDAAGKQITLYLGTSPTTSNVNIRLDGSNQVYLTNQITASQLTTSISSWISTTYLQLASANISTITVKNTNGTFVFTQDETNTWATSYALSDGFEFDETKWNSIRTSLVTLRMTEPVGTEMLPDYGFDSPSAMITYQFTDESGKETKQQLLLGNPTPDENGVYAKSDNATYVVIISNYNANQILEFSEESFTTLPVEETPES